MSTSRRRFLGGLAGVGIAACIPPLADAKSENEVFAQGVASGDPLTDRVILWTRVLPPARHATTAVHWSIARDPEMRDEVNKGVFHTSSDRDFTVKVDAIGLLPGTTYYYQFRYLGADSPVGRTRTLPLGSPARLRFAVASCSNFPRGFFNAYRAIANRSNLDFVIHLGDYIYEYANGTSGDGTAFGRVPAPNKEIVALSDYRMRYAQYRSDSDLQACHAAHPFIVVWDDHEVANDGWTDGAENHNPGEGAYSVRKAAAQQAWTEWMPVRETQAELDGQIYRSFRFGDLMDLAMLDTRHVGRNLQVAPNDPAIADPNRTLLGFPQEAWLYEQMSASKGAGTLWRFVGQQVMMGQLFQPTGAPFNPDQWDGYLASRNRFLGHLLTNGVGNVVVLSGDIHSSWGNDITFNPFNPALYNPATGTGSVAVEFVGPGITSPAIEDPVIAAGLRAQVLATHPHVKHVDLFRRGYLVIDVDRTRVRGEFYHPVTITAPNPAETFGGALEALSGSNHLTLA